MGNVPNPFVELYRSCNNGTNEEKYELIKSGELTLPRYIDVELTNACNFHCCFCPTGTNSMMRTKGFMPDDVVESLAASIEKYKIPGIRVIGWGEPTLHPKWLQILKRIKNIKLGENSHGGGVLIHLGTNGSLLTDENMREIVSMGIDSLKFSFQGADADSYNEMRDGGDYDTLMAKLKRMYEIRGESVRPYIQVSTTLTVEKAEQVESFRREVEQYCDYCNIGHTMLNHLSVEQMKIADDKKKKIKSMQEQESVKHVFRKVCTDAFDKFDVHWNGDMSLCCSDYDNFLVVGNIMDMDVKQIFNGKIADLYRNMIVKGEYGRIKCCSTCWETVPLTV